MSSIRWFACLNLLKAGTYTVLRPNYQKHPQEIVTAIKFRVSLPIQLWPNFSDLHTKTQMRHDMHLETTQFFYRLKQFCVKTYLFYLSSNLFQVFSRTAPTLSSFILSLDQTCLTLIYLQKILESSLLSILIFPNTSN